ncbi:MAG: MBL fold metallo-hydrolase [Chitinispirillia bacterium]|nr:MBL fold metallo-hydrolase [Chitinispirillia bacterium]
MNIRCWGSRGSFPACGPEYNRYGGDTACVEVRSQSGDLLIIDAGTGIRKLGDLLETEPPKSIHIIFTHAHLDHIMGFPFFVPIYNKSTKLHIYGPQTTAGSFESVLKNIMKDPFFPVEFDKLRADITFHDISQNPFTIGSLAITPIKLNHPNSGCGLRIEENGRAFVFLTDNELGDEDPGSNPTSYFESFCKGADLLFHDAEYTDEEYPLYIAWGHSKFTDAVRLALSSGVKKFGLFHINTRRTDDQMDELVKSAQEIVRENDSKMECFGVGFGFQCEL